MGTITRARTRGKSRKHEHGRARSVAFGRALFACAPRQATRLGGAQPSAPSACSWYGLLRAVGIPVPVMRLDERLVHEQRTDTVQELPAPAVRSGGDLVPPYPLASPNMVPCHVACLCRQERPQCLEPATPNRSGQLQHGLALPSQTAPGHGPAWKGTAGETVPAVAVRPGLDCDLGCLQGLGGLLLGKAVGAGQHDACTQDIAGGKRTGAAAGFKDFPVSVVLFEFEDGFHGKHLARDRLK